MVFKATMLKTMKISYVFTILVPIILILVFQTKLAISLNCNNNCTEYGDYGVCIDGKVCGCADFFGYNPNVGADGTCVKGIPFGSKCPSGLGGDLQCQIALGQLSKCNATTLVCDCYSITGDPVQHINGGCYKVKNLGDSCTSDPECILGSNDFGRCTNGTCACFANELFHLMPTEDGICEPMSCESGNGGVNISTLAVTLCISVAIFVLIVLIFRLTKTGDFIKQRNVASLGSGANANGIIHSAKPNHNHAPAHSTHVNPSFSNTNSTETLPI